MSSEIEAVRYGLQRTIYKKSFYEFVKDAVKVLEPSTEWDFNWHVKYLCDLLQKEAYRIKQKAPRINDWVINIPFRSMKSLIFSILFPCWIWTFFPECKIMTVAYAESLAVKQAYLSRILINSDWYRKYFPEVQLMKDDNAKGSMTNINGGTRQSFGITGQITGSGADIIIVDDPNKVNESKRQLSNTNDVFDNMVYNRLNDPEVGCRFVIQQRINQNDLSGHIESLDTDWETICIPAELSNNLNPPELIEHYVDGLFWERFNRRVLSQYKKTLGTRGYNSQLNQKTVSDGGNILKEQWFKIIEDIKQNNWDMFVDPAYTAKQNNDPTGILICKKIGNNLVVKKAFSLRLEFPDLIKKLKELGAEYNIVRLFIEPKASGLSIIQQLRKESKLNIIQLPSPKDDKETRVNAVSPIVEAERVHLIDGSWVSNFIEECSQFPLGLNDDMLDCLVYALDRYLIKNSFNYKM